MEYIQYVMGFLTTSVIFCALCSTFLNFGRQFYHFLADTLIEPPENDEEAAIIGDMIEM